VNLVQGKGRCHTYSKYSFDDDLRLHQMCYDPCRIWSRATYTDDYIVLILTTLLSINQSGAHTLMPPSLSRMVSPL
jgi:hypothetical protein